MPFREKKLSRVNGIRILNFYHIYIIRHAKTGLWYPIKCSTGKYNKEPQFAITKIHLRSSHFVKQQLLQIEQLSTDIVWYMLKTCYWLVTNRNPEKPFSFIFYLRFLFIIHVIFYYFLVLFLFIILLKMTNNNMEILP